MATKDGKKTLQLRLTEEMHGTISGYCKRDSKTLTRFVMEAIQAKMELEEAKGAGMPEKLSEVAEQLKLIRGGIDSMNTALTSMEGLQRAQTEVFKEQVKYFRKLAEQNSESN